MQSYEDIVAWQRAHQLLLDVYAMTKTFPADERYALTSQIRRSALSIPNNIAEGCKRKTQKEFAYFLNISEASASETSYLLKVSKDLGYANEDRVNELRAEVKEIEQMLFALRTKVEARKDRYPRDESS